MPGSSVAALAPQPIDDHGRHRTEGAQDKELKEAYVKETYRSLVEEAKIVTKKGPLAPVAYTLGAPTALRRLLPTRQPCRARTCGRSAHPVGCPAGRLMPPYITLHHGTASTRSCSQNASRPQCSSSPPTAVSAYSSTNARRPRASCSRGRAVVLASMPRSVPSRSTTKSTSMPVVVRQYITSERSESESRQARRSVRT